MERKERRKEAKIRKVPVQNHQSLGLRVVGRLLYGRLEAALGRVGTVLGHLWIPLKQSWERRGFFGGGSGRPQQERSECPISPRS